MITNEFAEASAEINEILGYLPIEYVEKIPAKLREFFNKVKKEDYVSKIDPYKQLDEQELKPKTKTLLTIIYRNYWCNEKERAELDKILIENDKKYEEELRERYNPDNIFKKKEIIEEKVETIESNLPVVINKNMFTKVWDFIKNLIKKQKKT